MYNESMRTTVEITAEYRTRLIEIAVRRGEKGFSTVLNEAIRTYLDVESERERRRSEVQALRGSLTEEEADALRANIRALRKTWR